MATSPIYSWPEPDDTSLVKNGALAIRTLGNAIDSTMATMVSKSIVDAKGDLIGATANDTPARLAVGTNGQVLTADSTAATGLAWATASAGSTNVAGKNAVLNSAMNVWQRGTSFASPATPSYTADRWSYLNSGAGAFTISRQATGDTTNLPFIQYALRYQRNSGQTATNVVYLTQSMESINSIPYAGKTITFSFYARAGANYSAASNILSLNVSSGTGTDQNINSSFTGIATVITQNATLTTTWQRFSYTGTVSSAATQLGFYVNWTPVGTAGANDYFEITGVQLEAAASASAYAPNASTYALELAACQRYYYRNTQTGSGTGITNNGGCVTTTIGQVITKLPVTMRVNPTAIEFSGINWYNYGNNTEYNTGTFTMLSATPDYVGIRYTHGSAIFTAGQVGGFTSGAGTSYIGFSAEL